MSILCIYNICGLSGRNNDHYYIRAIESILDQIAAKQVVVSSCCNTKETIDHLSQTFGKKILINWIKDKVPVNVSLNKSVKDFILNKGHCDYYLYMASDVQFTNNNQLQKLNELSQAGPYSLISAQTDTDLINYFNKPDTNNHWEVPLGQALNLHCTLFSNKWLNIYNGLMPTIFFGHCSESILTFMAAAIQTKWVMHKDVIVKHGQSIDGQSVVADISGWAASGKPTWCHPYIISENEFTERVLSNNYKNLGGGFEECRNILLHDSTKFDNNGYAIDPRLKDYIRDNFFLTPAEFNYSKINSEWIEC